MSARSVGSGGERGCIGWRMMILISMMSIGGSDVVIINIRSRGIVIVIVIVVVAAIGFLLRLLLLLVVLCRRRFGRRGLLGLQWHDGVSNGGCVGIDPPGVAIKEEVAANHADEEEEDGEL